MQLVKVPAGSAAAKAGLLDNDLIQGVNGQKVSNTSQLFAALNTAGSAPLKLRVIRNQKPVDLTLPATHFIGTETANDAKGFTKLIPAAMKDATVTASQKVDNDPLGVLTDGALNAGYGPVFANGIQLGIYKMDLGATKPVSAISSWSFNQNDNRGRQLVTIYGSNAESRSRLERQGREEVHPAWQHRYRLAARRPIHRRLAARAVRFHRSALSAGSPGKPHPANSTAENTAWQEFHVETAR